MTELKTLYRMAIFSEVVGYKSISGAAEHLGLSKSVVSRNIKWLEEDLGITLLTRTRQNITLTPAGSRYYQECTPLLTKANQLKETLHGEQDDIQGSIRLLCPISYHEKLIPELLDGFLNKYPAITFDVTYSEQTATFDDENIDVALHFGLLQDSNYYAKKVAEIEFVCLASPDYLKKVGHKIKTLEDVQQLNWILQAVPRNLNAIPVTTPGGEFVEFVPTGNIRTNICADKKDFIKRGLGVSVLPALDIAEDIRAGTMTTILDDHQWPSMGCFAVYAYRDIPRRVRTFIDHMSFSLPSQINSLLIKED